MNIHLVQSYEARAEALTIMATHKQYVVPTSGNPIRGLI
jgi:DNA-directed RNA polymerase I subunit RPA1